MANPVLNTAWLLAIHATVNEAEADIVSRESRKMSS